MKIEAFSFNSLHKLTNPSASTSDTISSNLENFFYYFFFIILIFVPFSDCPFQSERFEHALQRTGEGHKSLLAIRDEVRKRPAPWHADGPPDALRHRGTPGPSDVSKGPHAHALASPSSPGTGQS